MGFFGLYGITAALATTLTLAGAINCIGIGLQRGTHTRWQMVANDGTGAPTLIDMGASFAIATGGVLTLFIAAPPNAPSVWVRVVDEVSGALFEQESSADPPAATQFLSPRLFLNTGATAAAVAYDCAAVYLETDSDRPLPRGNERTIMNDQTTLAGEVARAFRDPAITAALTALIGGTMALIAKITRKAFTNEALLDRPDWELTTDRDRTDEQRS